MDAGTTQVSNPFPNERTCRTNSPNVTEEVQEDGLKVWVRGARQYYSCRSGLSGEPCASIGILVLDSTPLPRSGRHSAYANAKSRLGSAVWHEYIHIRAANMVFTIIWHTIYNILTIAAVAVINTPSSDKSHHPRCVFPSLPASWPLLSSRQRHGQQQNPSCRLSQNDKNSQQTASK